MIDNDVKLLARTLGLKDLDIISRMIIDRNNPDYVIATSPSFVNPRFYKRLKYYLSHCRDSIFILTSGECFEANLTIFDYASSFNPEFVCGDRIFHRVPLIYDASAETLLTNDLTLDSARKILESKPKFCNFVYSHPSEQRDNFFRLLSKYKYVNSHGRWLNNSGTKPIKHPANWYDLSINIKSGYKFSIAMENATYKGYITEKIISSLQAHTVPIYWGDPLAADVINPKAFINCNDYSSFEEVIERVKEIDNNDELWLDMVTQPWQTDQQREAVLRRVKENENIVQHIFSQDIHSARRRPEGMFADWCRENFTGFIGIVPPLPVVLLRKFKRAVNNGEAVNKVKDFLSRHI